MLHGDVRTRGLGELTVQHGRAVLRRADREPLNFVAFFPSFCAHWATHNALLIGVDEDEAAGLGEPTLATERLGISSEGFAQLCERVKDNLDAVLRWYA